jgi:hypothetical protein
MFQAKHMSSNADLSEDAVEALDATDAVAAVDTAVTGIEATDAVAAVIDQDIKQAALTVK